MVRNIFILIFLISISFISPSQEPTDQNIKILQTKLRAAKNQKSLALAYMNLGLSYKSQKDHTNSLLNLHKSLELFRELKDKGRIADLNTHVADIHYQRENYEKSIASNLEALKIYEELSQMSNKGRVLNRLGEIYKNQGNLQQALNSHQKAYQIFQSTGNESDLASVLSNIGIVYRNISQFQTALDYLFKSLKLREKQGNKTHISTVLNRIGRVYVDIQDINKALEFHRRSLKIAREVGDPDLISSPLNNIGLDYIYLGENQKALECYLKVLKNSERIGDKYYIAINMNDIGVIYKHLKKYDKSREYGLKALKLSESIGDKTNIMRCLINLGALHIELKDYKTALVYAKKTLSKAQESGIKDMIMRSYENLTAVYEGLKGFEKALEYSKKRNIAYEEMYNRNMSRQITQLQIQYDTLKKEKEIIDLKNKNKIQQLSLSKERITRNVSIIGFILIFLIISFFIKKYIYLFAFWKKQKYIGQFRLLDPIDSGGMGIVYKAHNIRDKKESVAIKVLREELSKSEINQKRFKHEAAVIDKLDHPHVVKIFERGEYKEKLYIVMELLEGTTLAEKIINEGPINLGDCIDIIKQILNALILIHNKEIIHRDLKPGNIMLIEQDGNKNYVKLLDFGLAKMKFQTQITQTGKIMGTINYMSPQQLRNLPLSTASDIYSLGIIFYEMLSGSPVYDGETFLDLSRQVFEKVIQPPKVIRPDLPEELNQLIMEMLNKSAKTRPSAQLIHNKLSDLFPTNKTH